MANVCVTDDFTVVDGVLGLNRLGDGACEAWPFTSDPSDTNGLKCDPSGGLWVAPEKEILQVAHTHSQAPNTSFGVSFATGTPLVANITNPSSLLTMLLVATVTVDFYVGQADGTSGTFSSFEVSVTRDNPTPTYVIKEANYRPTGIMPGQTAWPGTWTQQIVALLTPGQASTWRVTPRIRGFAGTTTYIQTTERIEGFGITL
jgi:hypothetical protein